MNRLHRIRPSLNIDPESTTSVLEGGHAVANGMGKDTVLYAVPVPSLVILMAQITKTDVAQQAAVGGGKIANAKRNVERALLFGMLETECAYVQTLCDAAAGRDQAVAVVLGAGMAVAGVPQRKDPTLKVMAGAVSGSVNLDANATELLEGKLGRRAFFNWQSTLDGGKTFHDAPSTPDGLTTIGNLPPLTMVGFRVCVTTRKGTGDWSPIVTVLVL